MVQGTFPVGVIDGANTQQKVCDNGIKLALLNLFWGSKKREKKTKKTTPTKEDVNIKRKPSLINSNMLESE